jgi:hypothetical protein
MFTKRYYIAYLVIFMAGCGDVPPFEGLDLRDALRADPKVIAAMSFESRRSLAHRILAVESIVAEPTPVSDLSLAPAQRILAADQAIQTKGKEAAILAVLRDKDGQLSLVRHLHTQKSIKNKMLPKLEGQPAKLTAAFEQRALQGQAGRRLQDLCTQTTNANRLQRVVGWPVGAVVMRNTVYVNASWLVIMESLEPQDPSLSPLSLTGRPLSAGSSSSSLSHFASRSPEESSSHTISLMKDTTATTDITPNQSTAGSQSSKGGCSTDCKTCTCENPTCSTTRDCGSGKSNTTCKKCDIIDGAGGDLCGLPALLWLLLVFAHIWWTTRRYKL